MTDYTKIPVDYMVEGMRRYIEDGIEPGNFMYALITNDLKGTFAYADETNKLFIREWVEWIYWEMPNVSQGSVAKVLDWIDEKRKAREAAEAS